MLARRFDRPEDPAVEADRMTARVQRIQRRSTAAAGDDGMAIPRLAERVGPDHRTSTHGKYGVLRICSIMRSMRAPAPPVQVHLSHRSNWLRAAVLGANDGIVSTASLVLGVAASGASASAIVTAGIAGLVAGALSMAAGEFVSVSSQRDAERADLRLEARELRTDPDGELRELATIYERRGLEPALADAVARALTRGDALEAHARDELGLDETRLARPLQAAWTSALAFSTGAALPLLAVALTPAGAHLAATVVVTLLALGLLGDLGARLGGAPRRPATVRVLAWGAVAMAVTAGIGALVGAVA
jgi:vacuolar iron transporter family protein